MRSESYYPDSNYDLNKANIPKETPVSEDHISNMKGDLIVIGLYGKNKWKASNDRIYMSLYYTLFMDSISNPLNV